MALLSQTTIRVYLDEYLADIARIKDLGRGRHLLEPIESLIISHYDELIQYLLDQQIEAYAEFRYHHIGPFVYKFRYKLEERKKVSNERNDHQNGGPAICRMVLPPACADTANGT